MRRASRKKHDILSSREETKAPPVVSGNARRQQPPQEVLQQRKKQQDELTSLTTKNYRLAKELADLRLKHRDECKHVTRLTMENMNLASRCREAISHVAMLKKELAMQQKRTAQALASQREQTKRMADSLTNSFISFSSPESVEPKSRSCDKKGYRISVAKDEDEGMMRLVSTTSSPDRDSIQRRFDDVDVDGSNHGRESKSKFRSKISSTTNAVNSSNTRTLGPSSPIKESRGSSSTTVTNSLTDESNENGIFEGRAPLTVSIQGESLKVQNDDLGKVRTTQNQYVLYSTPKKSERSKSSPFQSQNDNQFDDSKTEKTGLFPFSASPQVFKKSNSTVDKKTYDEGLPPDSIGQTETDNDEKNSKSKLKMTLMNSIDAFEKSFSTDFPDSFAPKEIISEGSGKNIYNPFFSTPEKSKPSLDQSVYITPNEKKKSTEPSKLSEIECKTPPKNTMSEPLKNIDKNSKDEMRPKRPEKTIPSAARARYERALGPRFESSSIKSVREIDKNLSSDGNNHLALLRRKQQNKRLSKNIESMPNDFKLETPSVDPSTFEQKHQPQESILNIVDTFEQAEGGSNDARNKPKKSTASRFQGPIKSLRRRSVKKPISYAEPPLNTKLRRGDTFFPKTGPETTRDDGDQNQVPNMIQSTAVVSP